MDKLKKINMRIFKGLGFKISSIEYDKEFRGQQEINNEMEMG